MTLEVAGASIVSFFGTTAGEVTAASIGSAVVGTGVNALVNKTPNLNVPPPPGAAMIDPAGSAAAAAARKRQALAGGLASTQTGAGQAAAAGAGPTSGAKALLGQ